MGHSSSTSADRKPHPSSNGKYKLIEDADAAKAVVRLLDGKRISRATRESLSRSRPEWIDIIEYIESSEGLDARQKRSFTKRWLENASRRKPDAWRPIRDALEACWNETIEDEPDDEKPERKPFTLDVMDSATFLANEYTLSWLVRGVLVKGQPCVIGGPKKTLKTSLLIDLAVSLATATKFLGKFTVDQPARVGFFSGESGPATIKDTALRVCVSKGVDPVDLGHITWGFKLPQLSHQEHLDELARVIHERQLEVVMVDPLYLCLLAGSPGRRLDPANLFDMGPLLLNVTEACLNEGATPAFSHHFKKNRESPYDTPELEDLAFAGIQEFARQWLLVGRREKYEPGSGVHHLWFTVGGSAGHSGDWAIDVDEGVMDDDFHGRHWTPTVQSTRDVRSEVHEREQTVRAERLIERDRAKEEARERADAELVVKLLDRLKAEPGRKATKKRLREVTAWRGDKVDRIVARALLIGCIREVCVEVMIGRGGSTPKEHPGYEWVCPPSEAPR